MVGNEFRVDQGTCGANHPDVAINAEGIFVVVWLQGGSIDPAVPCEAPGAVMGQIYDASGLPVGGNFEVAHRDSPRYLGPPQIAMSRAGFVVMWQELDNRAATYDQAWFVRRFDANGQAHGEKFRASFPGTVRSSARVALDDAGRFVIVWDSFATPRGVLARRFDTEGQVVGEEINVMPFPARTPRIATAPGRGYVVTARSNGIVTRLLDAGGIPSGDPLTVTGASTTSR